MVGRSRHAGDAEERVDVAGVGQDTFVGRVQVPVQLGHVCGGYARYAGWAALFLASDDSSFVTGIELFVDGGRAQI